jgi:hypothetical protein
MTHLTHSIHAPVTRRVDKAALKEAECADPFTASASGARTHVLRPHVRINPPRGLPTTSVAMANQLSETTQGCALLASCVTEKDLHEVGRHELVERHRFILGHNSALLTRSCTVGGEALHRLERHVRSGVTREVKGRF